MKGVRSAAQTGRVLLAHLGHLLSVLSPLQPVTDDTAPVGKIMETSLEEHIHLRPNLFATSHNLIFQPLYPLTFLTWLSASGFLPHLVEDYFFAI